MRSRFKRAGRSTFAVGRIHQDCQVPGTPQKIPAHREAIVYTLTPQRERMEFASYCMVDCSTDSEPAAPVENQGICGVVFIVGHRERDNPAK